MILAKNNAAAGGGATTDPSAGSQREGGGNNSMSIFQSYYGGIRSTREANEIYFIGIIDILQVSCVIEYLLPLFSSMSQLALQHW